MTRTNITVVDGGLWTRAKTRAIDREPGVSQHLFRLMAQERERLEREQAGATSGRR